MVRRGAALAVVGASTVIVASATADQQPVEPDQVTVIATRGLGPFARTMDPTSAEVWFRGGAAPTAMATLTADDASHSLVAMLTPREEPVTAVGGTQVWAGDVTSEGVAPAGTYNGQIQVSGRSPLQVTVRVRDLILWPLLAVALAALLGAFVVRWWDLHRRRQLLQADIKGLLETNAKAVKDLKGAVRSLLHFPGEVGPAVPNIFTLPWPPTGVPVCEHSKEPITDPVAQVERIYCQAQGAGYAELPRLAEQVQQARAALEEWLEFERELRRLLAVARSIGDRESQIWIDTTTLLGSLTVEPVDQTAREALIARIRRHVNVLVAFLETSRVWNQASDRRDDGEELNPETVYASVPAEADRSVAESDQLLQAFAEARDELGRRVSAELAGRGEAASLTLGFSMMPMIAGGLSILAQAVAPLGRSIPPQSRSSGAILAGLRRWSWVGSVAIALITAAAYVIPLYSGNDFGTCADYTGAIAAGLLGQVLVIALPGADPAAPV